MELHSLKTDRKLCEDIVRGRLIKIISTKWIVTHDPEFEKNYALKFPDYIKHAKLMGNNAEILVTPVYGKTFEVKLYQGSTFIVNALDTGSRKDGLSLFQLRTDADGTGGADTDKDGKIYVEKKILKNTIPSVYYLSVELSGKKISTHIPITIGTILTKLGYTPAIHNQKTLRPYTNPVDVRWDAHWPWQSDEEGFGLKISYDLADDATGLSFAFEDSSGGGGDMKGNICIGLN